MRELRSIRLGGFYLSSRAGVRIRLVPWFLGDEERGRSFPSMRYDDVDEVFLDICGVFRGLVAS